MQDKIFINIAGYREPELIPTLVSIYDKAKYPERVIVGVHQQDLEENNFLIKPMVWPRHIQQYLSNVQIIFTKYDESKGACWARAKINELITDEKYYLQIDSHSRLVQDWDIQLINSYNELSTELANDKIVFSQHPTAYYKSKVLDTGLVSPEKVEDTYIYNTEIFDIQDNNVPLFQACWFNTQITKPVKNYCVSAAFLFSKIEFILQCPIDPDIYFYGEEFDMAIRAYTNGWDIYTYHKNIVFHDYDRNLNPKHWGDNKDWGIYDLKAGGKLNQKLSGTLEGIYAFGTERTLADYQKDAKIDIARKLIKGIPVSLLRKKRTGEISSTNVEVSKPPISLVLEFDISELRVPDVMFYEIVIRDNAGTELYKENVNSSWPEFHLDKFRKEITIYSNTSPKDYSVQVVTTKGLGQKKTLYFTLMVNFETQKTFLQSTTEECHICNKKT